jgi:hydroxypyruvate reductase
MPLQSKDITAMRQDAVSIFNSAIASALAEAAVKRWCSSTQNYFHAGRHLFDLTQFQNVFVIGAGKAAAHMAKAIEDLLLPKISDGLVITKYGHNIPLKKIRILEAGHPVPDENGHKAALEMIVIAEKAQKNDLILCLISGGGSALLPLPAPGLTLMDKQKTIETLLACGASIDEINNLRKHLSRIKGGRLARIAHPATLITLILSDVPGDRLDVIASGPTSADPSTFHECMEIISKYQLTDRLPARVMELLKAGISGSIEETPKPGDPVFDQTVNIIVGSNADALAAAKQTAESLGYHAMILSSMIQGNTRDAALFHAAIAHEVRKTSNPLPPPACILSGGETTVNVTGQGMGGRNQEFALAAAIEVKSLENIVMLCAGTDGTDGPTDAAGAIIDSDTVRHAVMSGFDPESFLKNNDSYNFFKNTDNLLITGPTGTNVMDLRVVLVG